MWLLIILCIVILFVFAILKSGSDADDLAEKLMNKENNTYKNN